MSAGQLSEPIVRGLRIALVLLVCLASPTELIAAGSDLISAETISARADLRLVGGDGERSWADGGFGKTRFGGGDGGFRLRPFAAEAELIWEPRFSWSTHGTLVVAAQDDQDHPVDLVEAFLTFKPLPRGPVRVSGRAGLFWPAISLEHEGASWSVADMITPSAINSWIGEEVKLLGAEATAAKAGAAPALSATVGIFGFNDTAGTLLAFRGWALHDLKATAFGHQPLPSLNAFMIFAQAPRTRPTIELDDRPGFYGKLAWRPSPSVALDAFYYDNRGDPTAVNADLQWGWRTRFLTLGARIDLDEKTKLLAQALSGRTEMGFETADGIWVNTRYRAAYLRASHRRGPATFSLRFDGFGTRERGSEMGPEESEDGWAVAGAGSVALSRHANLVIEALHVESSRGSRARDGLDPEQARTMVQAALRLTL
jgi:hypothetical protein